MWSMGNEAGDGRNFEKVYNYLKNKNYFRVSQLKYHLKIFNNSDILFAKVF